MAHPAHHSDLESLRTHIGDCTRCSLAPGRSRLVFGSGDPGARVMLIGEAPGRNEDLTGEPFVGAAGKLLDELLAHAGLRRDEVYIANVLKCRPPGNRDPKPDEIESCAPFLHEQMRLVAPQIVVTLGNFATRFVLGTKEGITALHGVPQQRDDLVVLPVYHPAATIYDRKKRDALFDDFATLSELLGNGRPKERDDAPSDDKTGTLF